MRASLILARTTLLVVRDHGGGAPAQAGQAAGHPGADGGEDEGDEGQHPHQCLTEAKLREELLERDRLLAMAVIRKKHRMLTSPISPFGTPRHLAA